MTKPFIIEDNYHIEALTKRSRRTLAEMLVATRKQLKAANIKLALTRITLADFEKRKRRAVQGAKRKMKSLRNTVKRRRKIHG